MLISKRGTYLANIKAVSVESKDNGTAQAIIMFDAESLILANGDKEDAAGQGITGYFNLVTKAGKLNEINIRAIKDSLGWDGSSFSSLQDGDYAGVQVQIVCDEEEYQGKSSMRVKYLNPKDYAGIGPKKADSVTLKSLDAKFGAMLRATTAGMPSSGVPARTSVAAPATLSGPALGKEMAWKAFTKRVDDHNKSNPEDLFSEDDRKEVFKKVVTEAAKPKKPSELNADEWANVLNEIETNFSPATRELVPF